MACRDAYEIETTNMKQVSDNAPSPIQNVEDAVSVERLLFGVDSTVPPNDVLQNNLTEFDWVSRNKLYPNFWGRNMTGENSLTKDEIAFLHQKGCKIAAIYNSSDVMETEEQGKIEAKKAALVAMELRIPEKTAIFLEIAENANVTVAYMKGFAQSLLSEGYTPGFKTNTDAIYAFDREYSQGVQEAPELFHQCLIWAVSPSLAEYDGITTTHLIHPDDWAPYAPSGITRNEISIWQYGKNCHPIHNNTGKETTFNVDLVKDETVILNKMF